MAKKIRSEICEAQNNPGLFKSHDLKNLEGALKEIQVCSLQNVEQNYLVGNGICIRDHSTSHGLINDRL